MASLPPWLLTTPAEFLRASEAGASLGAQVGTERGRLTQDQVANALASRRMDLEQANEFNRLNFGYYQQAQVNERERQQLEAAKQYHAAALLQAGQRAAALDAYRQANMQRQREQAAAADQLKQQQLAKTKIISVPGGGVLAWNPTTDELTTLQEPTGKETTFSKEGIRAAYERVSDARKALSLLSKNSSRRPTAQKELDDALAELKSLGTGSTAADTLNAPQPDQIKKPDEDPLGLFK